MRSYARVKMNIAQKLTPAIRVNMRTFMTLVHIQSMPAENIIQKILGLYLLLSTTTLSFQMKPFH
jgi:hypothetical protein